jgi:hypothetical protein
MIVAGPKPIPPVGRVGLGVTAFSLGPRYRPVPSNIAVSSRTALRTVLGDLRPWDMMNAFSQVRSGDKTNVQNGNIFEVRKHSFWIYRKIIHSRAFLFPVIVLTAVWLGTFRQERNIIRKMLRKKGGMD